ncbi:hypothetical protein [Thermoactinomyces mirandus]|uniref:Uncharacterized protein n=1 Tax=Thermoactinomyces mirandus TaxID=2756294 RepID=A0A7W1XRM4_9BACL|nr:hypothetical protein [Thermoactinomyces mirandus]MBA4602043.1 hypothetical protein [Thermoactinomyces mirandus]
MEEEPEYVKAEVAYLKKAVSQSKREGVVQKQDRFSIIHPLQDRYSLTWLWNIAELSKVGYY